MLWIVVVLLMIIGNGTTELYKEKWRPQYHFTPPDHWMNDPNGLSFFKGYYHMFFQYNAEGIVIGNQSWGHAISKDMVFWNYVGIAIPRFENNFIFSGCAVIYNDTLNAIYTVYHELSEEEVIEDEYLSTSTDGFSFTSYPDNPILTHNTNQLQDPKVILYNNEYYVMAIAIPDERVIQFYKSYDLTEWTYLSQFEKKGDVEYHWEMPVLNRIKNTDHHDEECWILIVNVGDCAQYFFGNFDGTTFTSFEKTPKIRLVDYGPDFFETQTFYKSKELHDQDILIANVVNYHYALSLPTTIWRNTQSLPRKLTYREFIKGNRSSSHLFQEPIEELKNLRVSGQRKEYRNLVFHSSGEEAVRTFSLDFSKTMEIELEGFQILSSKNERCRFEIWVHTGGSEDEEEQKTIIGYEISGNEVYFDRSHSGLMNFSQYYEYNSTIFRTPQLNENLKNMKIYVDWSTVELFVNDGEYTITAVIFPEYESKKVFVGIRDCEESEKVVKIEKLNFYGLTSIHI